MKRTHLAAYLAAWWVRFCLRKISILGSSLPPCRILKWNVQRQIPKEKSYEKNFFKKINYFFELFIRTQTTCFRVSFGSKTYNSWCIVQGVWSVNEYNAERYMDTLLFLPHNHLSRWGRWHINRLRISTWYEIYNI